MDGQRAILSWGWSQLHLRSMDCRSILITAVDLWTKYNPHIHARTRFTATALVSWSITCNWPLSLPSAKGKQRDREKPPERFKTSAFKRCSHNVTQWISCTSAPTIHAAESIRRVGWTYSTLNLYWSVCLMACIIHTTLVYFPSGPCINNLFSFLLS